MKGRNEWEAEDPEYPDVRTFTSTTTNAILT